MDDGVTKYSESEKSREGFVQSKDVQNHSKGSVADFRPSGKIDSKTVVGVVRSGGCKKFWPPNSPDSNPLHNYKRSVVVKNSNKFRHQNNASQRTSIAEFVDMDRDSLKWNCKRSFKQKEVILSKCVR